MARGDFEALLAELKVGGRLSSLSSSHEADMLMVARRKFCGCPRVAPADEAGVADKDRELLRRSGPCYAGFKSARARGEERMALRVAPSPFR